MESRTRLRDPSRRSGNSTPITRKMKLRRYIAFVLCTLYIAATAGMALASVTCKCLGMRNGGVEHLGAVCHCPNCGALRSAGCCGEGLAAPDNAPAECGDGCQTACDCLFGSGCDCDRHSTEIDLYIATHSDDSEKALRCFAAELPPSLAAELPAPALRILCRGPRAADPAPRPCDGVFPVAALRAPPVVA